MIIDSHAHIGSDKEGISATKEELLQSMSKNEIDMAVVFPFDEVDPGEAFCRANNNIADAVSDVDNLIGFARTDPNSEKAVEEIKRSVVELGLRGLKLHPRGQKFSPTDRCVFVLMEEVAKLKIPVVMHTGRSDLELGVLTVELASLFPEITFILAHMGAKKSGSAHSVIETAEAGKNIENAFLETSRVLLPSAVERVVSLVGADRVIFGSDYPYGTYKQELSVIKYSDIDEEERELILGKNMSRILGIA